MKGHVPVVRLNIWLTFIRPSLKEKGKQIETNFIGGQGIMDCDVNFIDGDDVMPLIHLDVSNFFEDPSGKIDHWIGNDNV